MVNRKTSLKIRQVHRYLGLFLGLQFLMWTVSGLYFSWTDLDKIHSDHLRSEAPKQTTFKGLISPTALTPKVKVRSVSIRDIDNKPYYWINNNALYDARTGALKQSISQKEAMAVAKKHMRDDMVVKDVSMIDEVGKHSEFRFRKHFLPAYVINYTNPESIRSYVSAKDGGFKLITHRDWRIFDFLWMTHVMGYGDRDQINNLPLQIFSVLGLITALSGFLLWFVTSPTLRKIFVKK